MEKKYFHFIQVFILKKLVQNEKFRFKKSHARGNPGY